MLKCSAEKAREQYYNTKTDLDNVVYDTISFLAFGKMSLHPTKCSASRLSLAKPFAKVPTEILSVKTWNTLLRFHSTETLALYRGSFKAMQDTKHT